MARTSRSEPHMAGNRTGCFNDRRRNSRQSRIRLGRLHPLFTFATNPLAAVTILVLRWFVARIVPIHNRSRDQLARADQGPKPTRILLSGSRRRKRATWWRQQSARTGIAENGHRYGCRYIGRESSPDRCTRCLDIAGSRYRHAWDQSSFLRIATRPHSDENCLSRHPLRGIEPSEGTDSRR